MVLIYPYDEVLCFVVYQAYDGSCIRIDLENIKNEEDRNTIFPEND